MIKPTKFRNMLTGEIVTQFNLFDINHMQKLNDDGSVYIQPKKKKINYKTMSMSEIMAARIDNFNNGYR
jgi:hypothetical protein